MCVYIVYGRLMFEHYEVLRIEQTNRRFVVTPASAATDKLPFSRGNA